MYIFTLITLFFFNLLYSDETPKSYTPKDINSQYQEGPHFIYDCQNKSFVCVSYLNFQTCLNKRSKESKNNKLWYSCAPLKSYKTIRQCILNQMKAIHAQSNTSFCRNENFIWKNNDGK